MPQEDATAGCHRKLSQQDVTAGFQQDVTGVSHTSSIVARLSQQDVAVSESSESQQDVRKDVTAGGRSSKSQQHVTTG